MAGADERAPMPAPRPRLTRSVTVAVQQPWEIRPGPWSSSTPRLDPSPWFDETHEDDWEADPDDSGLGPCGLIAPNGEEVEPGLSDESYPNDP